MFVKVLQSILCLIYNGKTYLSTTAVEKMKAIVKMLGLKFPGGFDREILAKGSVPPTTNLFQLPETSPGPIARPRPGPKSKRPLYRGQNESPTPKKAKSSSPSPAPVATKVSATERMNLHIAMTLQLKDAAQGTSLPCKMPGCTAQVREIQKYYFLLTLPFSFQVTYEQLSSHFLAHENSATMGEENTPVSFPCVACGINFKNRRELDSHTKIKHGGGVSNLKEKLDLISDSSDDDDDSVGRVSDTNSVKSAKPMPKTKPKCNVCDSWFPTELHLKAHSCSSSRLVETSKCDTCFKSFKTNKALQVHMRFAHKSKSGQDGAAEVRSGNVKRENFSPSKRFQCQICTKGFVEFRQLRTHYTLYHFWENLEEDYKGWKDTCNICQKKYPTEDHLLQHMGNFHCKIDQYLVQKGLRIVSKEKTAKLLSWRCEICKTNQVSSVALKSHMAVKHFHRELLAEFPISRGKDKKCPKCFKKFDMGSVNTVVAHVGSFHDEVIKYAIEHIDLETVDIENVPIDDFDDGTVGVPVISEEYGCEKCNYKCKLKKDLVSHYFEEHYDQELIQRYPNSSCRLCPGPGSKVFPTPPMFSKHLVLKHEHVLWEILKEKGVSIPQTPRRLAVTQTRFDVFDYLQCQICQQPFNASSSLKIHYIRHFQSNFQSKYFTRDCPHCDKSFPDILSSQKHVATEHADKSLIPFMEEHKLWVNKSVVLQPGSAKLKRFDIHVKKLNKNAIRSHLNEIEQEKAEKVPEKHKCIIPGCQKDFLSRNDFLTHLVITHFWKEITVEFGENFNRNPQLCPICNSSSINPNNERTVFYKHLAIEHEVVLKYAEKSKTQPKPVHRPSLSLVNRMAPPPPAAPSMSSGTGAGSTPVLRFSNESEDDDDKTAKTNGTKGSGSDPVVKSEPVVASDQIMSRNEDLVSKIRNVFSDDSDSD